jgi:hypothetical protein
MVMAIEGYTGWHLLLYLLPLRWAAWLIARTLVRTIWKGASYEPGAAQLLIVLPGGPAFRITSAAGRVEPAGLEPGDLPPG